MLIKRHAQERGFADHGWLKARFSFSFADYYDPDHMGFRALRVINEDRIAPSGGFPTHGHRNMEVVTYILSGTLEHQDSTGNRETLRTGEVQRMSAGRGIRHSEFNASASEPLHLLQIWLLPEADDLEPGYEQKAFSVAEAPNRWHPIASRSREHGSLFIQQDVTILAARLEISKKLDHPLAPERHSWIQVARGKVEVNDRVLEAGDGLAVSDEARLSLQTIEEAEILLFDLA